MWLSGTVLLNFSDDQLTDLLTKTNKYLKYFFLNARNDTSAKPVVLNSSIFFKFQLALVHPFKTVFSFEPLVNIVDLYNIKGRIKNIEIQQFYYFI